MLTFSLLDSIQNFFGKEKSPESSEEYALNLEYFPVYIPLREWESSYDVKVYLMELYKHKDTEERRLQKNKLFSPQEKTIFDKDKVESGEQITVDYITSLPTISVHQLPQEMLPNKLKLEAENSPLFESSESSSN